MPVGRRTPYRPERPSESDKLSGGTLILPSDDVFVERLDKFPELTCELNVYTSHSPNLGYAWSIVSVYLPLTFYTRVTTDTTVKSKYTKIITFYAGSRIVFKNTIQEEVAPIVKNEEFWLNDLLTESPPIPLTIGPGEQFKINVLFFVSSVSDAPNLGIHLGKINKGDRNEFLPEIIQPYVNYNYL